MRRPNHHPVSPCPVHVVENLSQVRGTIRGRCGMMHNCATVARQGGERRECAPERELQTGRSRYPPPLRPGSSSDSLSLLLYEPQAITPARDVSAALAVRNTRRPYGWNNTTRTLACTRRTVGSRLAISRAIATASTARSLTRFYSRMASDRSVHRLVRPTSIHTQKLGSDPSTASVGMSFLSVASATWIT